MRDLVLIGIVGLCCLGSSVKPVFGMLCFVFFGILNPHSFTWGMARTFPASYCIALCTLAGYALWFRPKRLPLTRESIIMLCLWALFFLTTLYANYPDSAADALKKVSKVLLMVFLSMSMLCTRERVRWLMRIIAVAMGIHALRGGIFFFSTGGQQIVFGPEDTFLEGNNSFGLALAMNVPLLYFLAQTESSRWFRWTLRAMLVFSAPAIIGTFSRGAWLGLTAGLALIVLRSKHKLLLVPLGAVACIVALPLLPEKVQNRYEDLVNYEEESSAQSRLWNWEFATRVALAHPYLGAGFDYYGTEAYATYYPEFLVRWPGKVWSCHSVWFTMLSEHGFTGLGLWVLLFASIFFSLRKLRVKARSAPRYAWVLPYTFMLEGAFAAYAVSGTFFDAAYFDMFFQLVAVIVLLKGVLRAGEPQRPLVAVSAPAPGREVRSDGKAAGLESREGARGGALEPIGSGPG
jgi:putative inorganic carbon (HCO3(-)) transporter